jgi:hypothetical protein
LAEEEDKAVIICTINRVATTVDGGVRLTFDTDGSQAYVAAWLMGLKHTDGLVKLTIERENGQGE